MHEDLPGEGHLEDFKGLEWTKDAEAKGKKKLAKKALRKHKNAICDLQLAITSFAIGSLITRLMCNEETRKKWPIGRLWVIMEALYKQY